VAKTRDRKVFQELEFIARRMAALRSAGRARSDLHIADSNFGMYKEDIDLCRHIGDLQKRYSYPQYINVATGKNHKERVLDAARLINEITVGEEGHCLDEVVGARRNSRRPHRPVPLLDLSLIEGPVDLTGVVDRKRIRARASDTSENRPGAAYPAGHTRGRVLHASSIEVATDHDRIAMTDELMH
jgi:hypothetical protein